MFPRKFVLRLHSSMQTLKLETLAITTIEHNMYRDAPPVAIELHPLIRLTTLYSRDVYHEHGKERWLDVDFLIGILYTLVNRQYIWSPMLMLPIVSSKAYDSIPF